MDPFLYRERFEGGDYFLQKGDDLGFAGLQFQPARFQPGNIQQLVYQAQQPVSVAEDHAILFPDIARKFPGKHLLDRAGDQGQRGTKLVRNIGKKP